MKSSSINALITVGFPNLPYWIRLHVASANSTSQILESRLGFTGGARGEPEKWAQHPSSTRFRQLDDNLLMDKVISDLVEVALFIKDWKIYFYNQVSKWLFLYICLQFESGGALCDGDCMYLCVVNGILFSGD